MKLKEHRLTKPMSFNIVFITCGPCFFVFGCLRLRCVCTIRLLRTWANVFVCVRNLLNCSKTEV